MINLSNFAPSHYGRGLGRGCACSTNPLSNAFPQGERAGLLAHLQLLIPSSRYF
ncbi:hypothetical protein [Alysiella filiformis]|uniref:hypothetical protein n=1 Tax=Alysiella filiformis TaxID=194196 RepID=UPI0015C9E6E9|nr:hypothetical protein [Alysiella filiformis]